MLDALLKSSRTEQTLAFLQARGEGTAPEIAKYWGVPAAAMRRELDRLELAGIVCGRWIGRTRLYEFNPRYAFLAEIQALIEKTFTFYIPEDRERLLVVRKRPRRKGKPLP